MRYSKKLAALICASALILSASACSGSGDGSSGKNSSDSGKESTAESTQSGSDESSASSESTGSTESSAEESSETPAENVLDWSFRDVTKPAVKDAVYTDRSGAENVKQEIYTAKPEEYYDYEKAKKILKKDPKYANLQFVELIDEEQNYNKSETGTTRYKPVKDIYFIGYDADLDSIKSEFTKGVFNAYGDSVKVYLHTKQQFDKYDSPEVFELYVADDGLTQDDAFNTAKTIFDEKLAEYLVYQNFEYKYNDEHSNEMKDKVDTKDGKSSYTFKRSASKYSGRTSVVLGVEFDNKYSDNYYCTTYTPMEWAVPVSKMFETDIGGTDYLKPENFLDKTLSVDTKNSPYHHTVISMQQYDQATFSDGSAAERFLIQGYRVPQDKKDNGTDVSLSVASENAFELSSILRLNADKSVDVFDYKMRIPVTFYSIKDLNTSEVDGWVSTVKTNIGNMLKLDSKVLESGRDVIDDKSNEERDKEYSHSLRYEDTAIKVFGSEFETEMSINADADMVFGGTDGQVTDYTVYYRIGEI